MKTEVLPRIGAEVVDENLKSIGKVFDVLGPVSSPYVAVRPTVSEPQKLIKSMLYTIPASRRRKEKRRYGR